MNSFGTNFEAKHKVWIWARGDPSQKRQSDVSLCYSAALGISWSGVLLRLQGYPATLGLYSISPELFCFCFSGVCCCSRVMRSHLQCYAPLQLTRLHHDLSRRNAHKTLVVRANKYWTDEEKKHWYKDHPVQCLCYHTTCTRMERLRGMQQQALCLCLLGCSGLVYSTLLVQI